MSSIVPSGSWTIPARSSTEARRESLIGACLGERLWLCSCVAADDGDGVRMVDQDVARMEKIRDKIMFRSIAQPRARAAA